MWPYCRSPSPSFGLFLVHFSGRLAETRLALVISNAGYPPEIGSLENPHKDGVVIAAALEGVGFERRNITVLKDADQPTMRLAIADFIERIEKAGSDAVVFLYYSGHGAADRTERGENYLIPVGAKITLARQLPILGVSLSEITKALERVPAQQCLRQCARQHPADAGSTRRGGLQGDPAEGRRSNQGDADTVDRGRAADAVQV